MSMTDWAKREVEIACKKERGNSDGDEWDYGCACYESALKAYKSLCKDGHSGMSIGVTKNILNRLIEGKPLTPIEDTPDVWELCCFENHGAEKQYQCKRMSSLFKKVYPDGTVTYNDIDRFWFTDKNELCSYHNGFLAKIMQELYPLKMPYFPGRQMKVVCEDFLSEPGNGDYDTKAILYCVENDGKRVDINRYFKDGDDSMIEITEEEYAERKLKADRLKGALKEETKNSL